MCPEGTPERSGNTPDIIKKKGGENEKNAGAGRPRIADAWKDVLFHHPITVRDTIPQTYLWERSRFRFGVHDGRKGCAPMWREKCFQTEDYRTDSAYGIREMTHGNGIRSISRIW